MFRMVMSCALLWAFFVAGCAPQDQVTFLEKRVYSLSVKNQELAKDMNALKGQVEALKKAQESLGEGKLLELRSRQAVFQTRLDEINAELLRVSGMIEEMKHTYQSDREKDQAILTALQADVASLRKQLRVLESKSLVAKKVQEAKKKVEQSGLDLYQKGLDLIRQKQYKEARRVLESYIKAYPKGERVANAYFWIGECEFSLKRFEEAILAYDKVVSQFPKSNKVAPALLKEGMAFFSLGDPESAKIVWNKLIKSYPKSSQAQVAKRQLARLR